MNKNLKRRKQAVALKAISYKLLVKPDEVELKTKSGIVIATDEKAEKGAQKIGVIVCIGGDAFLTYHPKSEFCGLKIGDKVHYPRYAGKWVKDSKTGEEFLVILDDDICVK